MMKIDEEQAVIVAAIRAELERQASTSKGPEAVAIMEIMMNGWLDDLALADAMLAAFAKYHYPRMVRL